MTRGQVGGSAVLGALGVVFGDIGTSPIYTAQTVFNPDEPRRVAIEAASVYGVVSLIFWSVLLIVTVTYVLLVMRADNDGEGGIMALITLVLERTVGGSRRTTLLLAGLGIFGAALFFSDSMITPAISVLSAVEGLRTVDEGLESVIVPLAVAIIVVLFLLQRRGTAAVGRLFGPVMVVWFVVIGVLGIGGIALEPGILRALSPTYAVEFLAGNFAVAFFAMAAIVLAVTGAEALYADMGHFGRPAIARAWLALVFPACTLSYFGQGALLLDDPSNVSAPFFLLVPDALALPLVALATAATVIASQAVITGAFSVAHQAVQLGYLPRLRILHTSERTYGQIYVPWINWVLMVAVVALVLVFQESTRLAYAFGMAVTGTILITTALFLVIARRSWRTPLWLIAIGVVVLLGLDGLFLAANLTKLPDGAWLPLAIGILAFTVLVTWQRGRGLVTRRREEAEGRLDAFVRGLHEAQPPLQRTPGTAVFLNRNAQTAPLAMRAAVDHLGALHRHVVILTVETESVPHVAAADRLSVDDLGFRDDGIFHVTARFGYADQPDIPATLRDIAKADLECTLEVDDASYFLSKIELIRGDGPGLARWRKRLFVATSRITADAAEYFRLPRERTVVMGSRIEV